MHPSWYRTVKSAAIQHSGRDGKRRQELIAHEKIAVDKKNQDEVEKKARDAARKAEMPNLTPYLDTAWIQANHTGIKGTDVEKQINWHRQFVEKEVISGKTDKVTRLIVAVTRFKRDILPKLQLLATAATTAGIVNDEILEGDADIQYHGPGVPPRSVVKCAGKVVNTHYKLRVLLRHI
ncbi:hypothetical protein B0H11DRAFT_1940231 [Mycena galericulata]|nr:hypothetical protein B0H11DRAFT_1940231 [Mycena galericulata]